MIELGTVVACVVNKIVDGHEWMGGNFEVVSDSTEASSFVLDFVSEEGIIDGEAICKGGLEVALQVRRILCD